jgi:hypothetical protein
MKTQFGDKLKNYKEQESEKTHGKKRYQERLIEQQEAEKEIKQYKHEESDTLDNDDKPFSEQLR